METEIQNGLDSKKKRAPRRRSTRRTAKAKTKEKDATGTPSGGDTDGDAGTSKDSSTRQPRQPARSPRSRARTAARATDKAEAGDAPPTAPEAGESSEKAPAATRNPRFRRGSRGLPSAKPPASTQQVTDSESEASDVTPTRAQQINWNRSLGARKGSRRGVPPSSGQEESTASTKTPDEAEVTKPAREETLVREVKSTDAAPDSSSPDTGVLDSGSFFKRIGSAFQRALRGDQEADGGDSQGQ